jgi:putative PIG3 family NAD(P)H quinone oxidoreductase
VALMKFLRISEDGARYRAELAESERPVPAAGEVLVKVAASGLNRADLAQAAGRYPPPSGESEIPGLEVSGTVEETGEPVCALLGGGGHAEYAAVPTGQILPATAGSNLRDAAGIPEAYLTAYLNLGNVASGESVLIHAGASGVGLAAIQLSKLLGARVAATTRTSAKLAALRDSGADLAIDTTAKRFEEAVESAWGPDSVDAILDPVGAATLAGDLRILKTGGRVIFLATMSGARAEFDLRALMAKRGRLIGSTLRSRSRAEKAELIARFRREILPGLVDGRLRVVIDSVFPPARAAEAFGRMRENRNIGKILIDWSGIGD